MAKEKAAVRPSLLELLLLGLRLGLGLRLLLLLPLLGGLFGSEGGRRGLLSAVALLLLAALFALAAAGSLVLFLPSTAVIFFIPQSSYHNFVDRGREDMTVQKYIID